ncbi:MAG: FAD-dependent oxidoreductase [Dehalococcoidales bacterium]|nr:FAD-dependent oxidoreductase [Dehalococcoidales bacterium]
MVTAKTVHESPRETNILAEADVVVVGAGPAGVTAATAAAREGADTILMDRYGHLGGMATGGLVLMFSPSAGQGQEWMDRLNKVNGVHDLSRTSEPEWGHTKMVDPELLKCILNDMTLEAGVRMLLHSWSSAAVVDNNTVKGIIFESKSGRQAVMGKVIIDATGDGDVYASAGAEFDASLDKGYRTSEMAMVFRIGGIDFDKFAEFRKAQPQEWVKLREEGFELAGFHIAPIPGQRQDVFWVNNFIRGKNCLKVEDLNWVEVNVRKIMIPLYSFYKKAIPGFENSYLYDSASQIGTRGSRRLVGAHVLTGEEAKAGKKFDDTVLIFPRGVPLSWPADRPPENVEMPYRCLVPEKLDGLLAAGRCFSSDQAANSMFNVISHCIQMGQAAGTAAALAVKSKVQPRDIDITALQKSLIAQGVELP